MARRAMAARPGAARPGAAPPGPALPARLFRAAWLALWLPFAAPALAQADDGGVLVSRIEISTALQPAGPKPVLLVTVPEPDDSPDPR
jgi:hypothetical protein